MRQNVQTTNGPVYQRLAGLLEGMIQNRSLRPGDRMPSVRQFSRQQRVSVPTALNAYATLETRGLIEARPKSGFFVRARQADLIREPAGANGTPRVVNFTDEDPFEALMADHGHTRQVPLGAAIPNMKLLPGEKLARIMGAVARKLGPDSAGYDIAPGSETLRREIAKRSLGWGCALKPEDFVITVGCTEAVSLALRVVCKPGDTVVVESPTYFNLAQTLRDLQLRALPVPVDNANGLDLAALEKALRRNRVAACALIPNFHNPTGALMPDEKKKQLVSLLAARKIPVIEDDIYGDLQHEGQRPRCLKAFDRDSGVILCSSFSKTIAPGYRIGYIAAGRWHSQVLSLKKTSTIANATLPSLAMAEFLRNGGYDRYLRTVRQAYRHQVERMRDAIVDSFPSGIGLSRPQGGFVLWCELPSGVDAVEVFKQARAAGISLAPGPLFAPGGGFRHFIRLNCGHPWSPQIERAVGVLGHLVKRQTGR